jgi:hypothetical protein
MQDLSHGIIRAEDQEQDFNARRKSQFYFGELDNIAATQLYSLASNKDSDPVSSWFGDGVVEKESLGALSASVYGRKDQPDERVLVIWGASHFSILQNEETRNLLKKVLSQP